MHGPFWKPLIFALAAFGGAIAIDRTRDRCFFATRGGYGESSLWLMYPRTQRGFERVAANATQEPESGSPVITVCPGDEPWWA